MIWIIGCKGMLGQEVCRVLGERGTGYMESDIEVDITNPRELINFAASSPTPLTWIVNCSAYTAVDQAEDDAEKAFAINAEGVKNIAELSKQINAQMIHISTDYVFDGESETPYTETDQVHPIGVYGKSKAEGERLLQKACSDYYIIRTAWLYGFRGKNFVQTMLRLMSERDEISVVNDQHGSPTYAPHLAEVIADVMSADNGEYGIYHYTNEGRTTWYAFADTIYRQAQEIGLLTSECTINPIPSSAYPTRAKRPAYSYLDKSKISSVFDLSIPDWTDGLHSYLNEVKNHA